MTDTTRDTEGRVTDTESRFITYGRGVRTTLRSNATAYGFSISITSEIGRAHV